MSTSTEPKPADQETSTPAPGHEEHPKKREDEKFHPHKHHDHMVIERQGTDVAHVDPGAIVIP